MRIIKPSFEIITKIDGEQILKEIEIAARTCYKSEGKIRYGHSNFEDGRINWDLPSDSMAISARELLPKLIKRGHHAMLEFGGTIHVKFTNDRGVSHEEVRHRLASFAQESTRYCNYSEDEATDGDQGLAIIDITPHLKNPTISLSLWMDAMLYAEKTYNAMIDAGETPQIARSVLPNSLKTEINIAANVREWRHIFKMRTPVSAHPQIREVMIPLLAEFKQRIPILFDDIVV